jgi:hypothetical protein
MMSKHMSAEEIGRFREAMAPILHYLDDSVQSFQHAIMNLFDSVVCPACQRKAHEHTENDWKNCVAKLAPS